MSFLSITDAAITENKKYFRTGSKSIAWGRTKLGSGDSMDVIVINKSVNTDIDSYITADANAEYNFLYSKIGVNPLEPAYTETENSFVFVPSLEVSEIECVITAIPGKELPSDEDMRRWVESMGVVKFTTLYYLLYSKRYSDWAMIFTSVNIGAHGTIPTIAVFDNDWSSFVNKYISVPFGQSDDSALMFYYLQEVSELCNGDLIVFRVQNKSKGTMCTIVFNKKFCAYAGRRTSEYFMLGVRTLLGYNAEEYHLIGNDYGNNATNNVDGKDVPPEDPMAFLLWGASKGK